MERTFKSNQAAAVKTRGPQWHNFVNLHSVTEVIINIHIIFVQTIRKTVNKSQVKTGKSEAE